MPCSSGQGNPWDYNSSSTEVKKVRDELFRVKNLAIKSAKQSELIISELDLTTRLLCMICRSGNVDELLKNDAELKVWWKYHQMVDKERENNVQ